jgi:hypothetical protein
MQAGEKIFGASVSLASAGQTSRLGFFKEQGISR